MTTYIDQPADQYRFIPPLPQDGILTDLEPPLHSPLKRLTLIAK